MIARTKHNAGFTLAELLIVIAIILVLAALAIPSIITAQNNMRMLELNNAAESIANAAQTQMTAKKVAGTWLSAIEKGGTGADSSECRFQKAQNRPTNNVSEGLREVSEDVFKDTYYMTATEAQAANLITGLSLDDSVRAGNYLIEFTASTANVVSVFYTDGKSGFFGTPGSYDVVGYYSGNTARYQSTRMKNSPMIGYYQGTPSAATNAVALKNPTIWVDEENAELCIENPNLDGRQSWAKKSSLSVTIENLEPVEGKNGVSFTISGLQGDGLTSTGVIESSDPKVSFKLANEDGKVYRLGSRTGADTTGSVFRIDLNALATELETAGDSADDPKTEGNSAKDLMSRFSSNDQLLVNAEVSVPSISCVPATAKAYVRWPEPLAKLTVLVTNPSYGFLDEAGTKPKGDSYIKGKYVSPTVDLVDSDGNDPVTEIGKKAKEKTEIYELYKGGASHTANNALGGENIEETRQVYSGKWVRLAEAASQDANMKVTVGSYTPNGSTIDTGTKELGRVQSGTSTHTYQIYEIWVNKQRAGYLDNDVWHWDGGVGQVFANSGCVDQLTEGNATSSIETLTIDTRKLYETDKNVIPLNDDGGYDVYVRTTPKTAEVKAYFEKQAVGLANYLSWSSNVGTTGSRGANKGAPVRKPFENEFGASSTVALWNTSTMSGTMDNLPEAKDLRVYYTAAPAIAWGDMKFGSNDFSPYTTLPSAVLWFFPKNTSYSWDSPGTPDAYVRDIKSDDEDHPQVFKLRATSSADYEIPYGSTTPGFLSEGSDQLFYRAIEYYGEDGKRINWQYVPYTVQDNANYATVPNGPAKEGYAFTGWHVDEASTSPVDKNLVIPAGALIGTYDNKLVHGAVKLTAQYVKVGVGFAYVEFGAKGNLVGWAGYISNYQEKFESHLAPDDVEVASFGYYVVAPQGMKPSAESEDYRERSLVKQYEAVNVISDGTLYDLYRIGGYVSIPTGYGEMRSSTKTIMYVCGSEKARYTFNLNFAAAVAKEGDKSVDSTVWGTAEDPWKVRHGLQFPGAVPNNNASGTYPQSVYQGDSFVQEHDIDMVPTAIALANKYDWAFRGSYDGASYSIKNVHSRFLSTQADIGIKGLNSTVRAWGLFPAASGAAFANISIIEDANPNKLNLNGTNGFSFGMLVGYAEGCTFENCSVDGAKNTVFVTCPSNNTIVIGGLIGKAVNTTITGCEVSRFSVSLSSTNGSAWRVDPALGGLVGHLLDSSIERENQGVLSATVFDVELSVTTESAEGFSQYYGGVVGRVEGKDANIKKSFADTVKMTGPAREDVTVDTMKAGSYVGRNDRKGNPITGNGDSVNILQRYGDEEYTEVTAEIGYENA